MKFWQAINKKQLWTLIILGVVFIMRPLGLLAAEDCTAYGEAQLAKLTGSEYIKEFKTPYYFEQPFGGAASVDNFGDYIQLVYQFALGLVGIIAVVLIMFGGARWIMAAGNEQVISEAKDTIKSAVLGLVIALLSYMILLVISPKLVETDVAVYKIPIPFKCPFPPPTLETIPTIAGVTGSGRICAGAVAALQNVANYMLTGPDGIAGNTDDVCRTCKIGIGSTYRTTDEQIVLYECYQRAAAEGNTTGKSPCPSGCSSCNKAAEPCCSNHETGTAMDLWLEGVPPDQGIESSYGYLAGYYNNGGAGGDMVKSGYNCDSAPYIFLCKNQYLLRQIMTSTGQFKGISNEWWHFDYIGGSCTGETTCISYNGYATNTYCQDNTGSLFSKADCSGTTPTCAAMGSTSATLISMACGSTQYIAFSQGQTPATGYKDVYTAKPNCENKPTTTTTTGPKF